MLDQLRHSNHYYPVCVNYTSEKYSSKNLQTPVLNPDKCSLNPALLMRGRLRFADDRHCVGLDPCNVLTVACITVYVTNELDGRDMVAVCRCSETFHLLP